MKRMDIDFAPPRARPSATAGLLLLTGIGLFGWACWQSWALLQRSEALEQTISALSHQDDRRAASPAFTLPAARILAINQAVRALNVPWDDLFRSLEAEEYRNVALLALTPDSDKGTIAIQAEAKNVDDMHHFLTVLQENPTIKEPVLLHHEVNGQDPNRPIRFTVSAVWRKE